MSNLTLPTVRESPRISVNKLGEYLTCNATRRRRIIADAKRPKDFIVPRFNDFYAVALRYLTSSPFDDRIVEAAVAELHNREPGSEWEEQNKGIVLDLLGNLLDVADLLPVENVTYTELPNSQADLEIAGVSVSVRPELQIVAEAKGVRTLGALKLYLPKTFPLDEESGAFVATTVHQHICAYPPVDLEVDHRLCLVADVPSRTVYAAPRSFTRRRNEIAVACEEIAARWPAV